MCAIVGMKGINAMADVEQMLGAISYRGPDDRHLMTADGWSLGHARLSILDVTGGAQPMDSDSGSRIVHNGEIYNFRELREQLGGDFRTQTDTEVILRLYESGRPPEEWLNQLDGMFAFAIVDKNGVFLARDPLGVKPLYIGLKDNQIVFGSEIKAVLAFADRIMEFPPGHVYTTAGGGRPYIEIKEDSAVEADFDAIKDQLLAMLRSSVRSRLISDVPVGVFLSGGLDSSIIAALACEVSPHIKTFAVGLEGSADLEAAKQVAEYLGTDHHERVFTLREATEALPKVIYHLESFDAALVRSAVANFFLAEKTSKHVKVALSGEGADELFAGYSYLSAIHGTNLSNELRKITDELHFTNLQRCDRMSMAHGLEVRVPFLDDLKLVQYAMGIPVQYKLEPKKNVEKWVLRKAAEGLLPKDIVWRKKRKFADGAGLAEELSTWANEQLTPTASESALQKYAKYKLRDTEELVYFLIFKSKFPAHRVAPLIGRSRSY